VTVLFNISVGFLLFIFFRLAICLILFVNTNARSRSVFVVDFNNVWIFGEVRRMRQRKKCKKKTVNLDDVYIFFGGAECSRSAQNL
jgi:hypothetical protein